MLIGVCKNTGHRIKGWDRCKQSISTIIEAQIGTYIGMRHFGNYLYDLIDEPQTSYFLAVAMAQIANALSRFEPEFLLEEFELLEATSEGKSLIAIKGLYKPLSSDQSKAQTMEIVL